MLGISVIALTLSGCASTESVSPTQSTDDVKNNGGSSLDSDGIGKDLTPISARLTLTYIADTFNPEGTGSEPFSATLNCDLDGTGSGSIGEATDACKYLSDNKLLYLEPFGAPASEGAICTKIYGGPSSIEIIGVINGEDIAITLNRVDGCKIDEWDSWILGIPALIPSSAIINDVG
jgi:hypothetical protein